MCFNLEADNIGIFIPGYNHQIKESDTVKCTGKIVDGLRGQCKLIIGDDLIDSF